MFVIEKYVIPASSVVIFNSPLPYELSPLKNAISSPPLLSYLLILISVVALGDKLFTLISPEDGVPDPS